MSAMGLSDKVWWPLSAGQRRVRDIVVEGKLPIACGWDGKLNRW